MIEELRHPTVLALTATASPLIRDEVVERLAMRDPAIVARAFDRPNIWLGVETFHAEGAKDRALVEQVSASEKPGIVYSATRKRAEELASALRERGVRALAYHAGMAARERDRVQEAFMSDEAEVIVATVAFGMGIDKPNVRFVFHSEVSDSVDSYYQEVGRAGRDGENAKAVLFYRQEDFGLRRFFAGAGRVGADDVERVAEAVERHERPVDADELREETELSETKLMTALSRLEEVDEVAVLPTGAVVSDEGGGDVAHAAGKQKERRSATGSSSGRASR